MKGTKANTREYKEIISLPGLSESAVEFLRGIGRSGSKEHTAVGPFKGIAEGELALAGRVGKGEDDGGFVQLGHAPDGGLGKGAKSGGETDKGGGLDVLNNRLERRVLLAFSIVSDKVLFVGSDLSRNDIGASRGDETLQNVSMLSGSVVIRLPWCQ